MDELIRITNLIINLGIIGSIPFLAKWLHMAFSEQKEALRLKNEYLKEISVKDFREQIQALKAEYEDRIRRMENHIIQIFAENQVKMVQDQRNEICLDRINSIIANSQSSGDGQINYNAILDELSYAAARFQVIGKLPPDIRLELEKRDPLISMYKELQLAASMHIARTNQQDK